MKTSLREDGMVLAREKVAQVWCTPTTEKLTMIPELAEEFAKTLNEIWSKPWLGNATTAELIDELRTRCEMNGTLNYRTVDI